MYVAVKGGERAIDNAHRLLAAARRAGRTGGRPPKLTDDDIEAAKALLASHLGVAKIRYLQQRF